MKKFAAFILFALVGCASIPAPTTIAEAAKAVVAIEFETDDASLVGRTHCSGVAVSPGVIITNGHCTSIDEKRRYVVRFKDGSHTKGILVSKAVDGRDAAVISVDPRFTKHFARIAEVPPVEGDHVFAVGHPMGLRWSVSAGIVSNANRELHTGDAEVDKYNWIQVDAAINPGNSGGALFNARGELLGITTLKYVGDNMGFAIPIHDFLDSVSEFLK